MHRKSLRACALLLPLACVEQTWDEVVGPHLPHGTSSTSSSTTSPTTLLDEEPSAPLQTVTGPPEWTSTSSSESTSPSTSTTTSGPAENEPPTVEFVAVPDQLSEAGKSELKLTASDDVVKVRLYQNDELLAVLSPDKFPYAYEALSAAYNANHHFAVEVEDAEGLTATDDAWVNVLLPESGTERCSFADTNVQSSAITGVAYADDAIVAAGWRDTGAGPRIAIWKLDRATCKLQDGWPLTLANWTADAELTNTTSRAVGVAVDSHGYLAIAANLWPGGRPQAYVALLNPQGSRIWERLGTINHEVAGVTVDEQDDVFAVGNRRTSEAPLYTDAMVWGYRRFDDDTIVVWENSLRAPFTPDEIEPDLENIYSERARAVLAIHDELVVVGDRTFRDLNLKTYTRSFVARYHLYGELSDLPWTSPGDYLSHDTMYAVSRCGEALIAGGWTKDEAPNASTFPLMRWIEPDELVGLHGEPFPAAQTFGIACDRESKVISAGVRWLGDFNAQVFASKDVKKPSLIYDSGSINHDAMLALACEAMGFCAAGGFRSEAESYGWLRVYHP